MSENIKITISAIVVAVGIISGIRVLSVGIPFYIKLFS